MGRRICYPSCAEKRDFMQVDPPKNDRELYLQYDPMVGVGTALTLILFFFVITVKSCFRWGYRKFHMHKFNQTRKKEEEQKKALMISTVQIVSV